MMIARKSYVRSGNAGFTLLELLTVIVIIGILAGMISTAVMLAKKKAQSVARTAEIATIKSAIEAYRFEYQEWPCPESQMTTPPSTVTYKNSSGYENKIIIDDWLMETGMKGERNDRGIKFLNVGDYKKDASGNLVDSDGNAYEIVFDFDNDKVSVN